MYTQYFESINFSERRENTIKKLYKDDEMFEAQQESPCCVCVCVCVCATFFYFKVYDVLSKPISR